MRVGLGLLLCWLFACLHVYALQLQAALVSLAGIACCLFIAVGLGFWLLLACYMPTCACAAMPNIQAWFFLHTKLFVYCCIPSKHLLLCIFRYQTLSQPAVQPLKIESIASPVRSPVYCFQGMVSCCCIHLLAITMTPVCRDILTTLDKQQVYER